MFSGAVPISRKPALTQICGWLGAERDIAQGSSLFFLSQRAAVGTSGVTAVAAGSPFFVLSPVQLARTHLFPVSIFSVLKG